MKKIVLACSILILFGACSQPENVIQPEPAFDRAKMLQHFAQQLIRPAFTDLSTQVNALEAAVQAFSSTPTADLLETAREKWLAAAISWQYALSYNFGPAGEEGLRKRLFDEIGTFPASEENVETALAAGQWDLSDANRDARGLYAMEYLIFGKNGDLQQVVERFIQSPVRLQYLAALSADLKTRVTAVETGWQTYEATFTGDAGTSAGSSTSLIFNELVESFKVLKNYKIGLPLGKHPGWPAISPEKVEAYYSGNSLELFEHHLIALENLWYGRTRAGVDGLGFREYLEDVTGGHELVGQTETQLTNIKTALAAVPKDQTLSAQLTSNPAPIEALYNELVKHTRFFKSDMSSLLGIAITFSTGDGD